MNNDLFKRFSDFSPSVEVVYIVNKILPKMINYEGKILELGVGNGEVSNMLSENYDVYCIDISKECLDKLNEKVKKKIQLDLDNRNLHIPFPDNYFDSILAFEILEHIKNFEVVIKEIKRILKPGGFVFATTPNINWWPFRIKFLLGMCPEDFHTVDHVNFWNLKRFAEIFKKEGFKINKQIVSLGLFNFLYPFVRKFKKNYFEIYDKYIFIASNLKTSFLGYDQVIIAEK